MPSQLPEWPLARNVHYRFFRQQLEGVSRSLGLVCNDPVAACVMALDVHASLHQFVVVTGPISAGKSTVVHLWKKYVQKTVRPPVLLYQRVYLQALSGSRRSGGGARDDRDRTSAQPAGRSASHRHRQQQHQHQHQHQQAPFGAGGNKKGAEAGENNNGGLFGEAHKWAGANSNNNNNNNKNNNSNNNNNTNNNNSNNNNNNDNDNNYNCKDDKKKQQ